VWRLTLPFESTESGVFQHRPVESSAAAWAWFYRAERHPEGLAASQGFELLVMIQYHPMQRELAGAISKDHAYTLAI